MRANFEVSCHVNGVDHIIIMKDELDRWEAMRRATNKIAHDLGVDPLQVRVNGCEQFWT